MEGRWKFFQYNEGDEKISETRNILLVVFTLVAAVTFQAVMNPPGGVWQDNENGHEPGIYKFPLQMEIRLASAFMAVTYGAAIFAITPREVVKFRYLFLAAFAPAVLRLARLICYNHPVLQNNECVQDPAPPV
ncbi:PGG domain [Sesbania bispinosa]|nr:PGG domain [Sesbania bispinosa]